MGTATIAILLCLFAAQTYAQNYLAPFSEVDTNTTVGNYMQGANIVATVGFAGSSTSSFSFVATFPQTAFDASVTPTVITNDPSTLCNTPTVSSTGGLSTITTTCSAGTVNSLTINVNAKLIANAPPGSLYTITSTVSTSGLPDLSNSIQFYIGAPTTTVAPVSTTTADPSVSTTTPDPSVSTTTPDPSVSTTTVTPVTTTSPVTSTSDPSVSTTTVTPVTTTTNPASTTISPTSTTTRPASTTVSPATTTAEPTSSAVSVAAPLAMVAAITSLVLVL